MHHPPTSMVIPLHLLCITTCALSLLFTQNASAGRDYHVAMTGNDTNAGTAAQPLRTIQAAANMAMPGDTITVHEGIYRERIDPPRGGTSDDQRITYQAAPGETVTIKGSKRIKGWEKVRHNTWKVTLPDSFFGDFNPYKQTVEGDWFQSITGAHHLGIIYHHGHWLTETTSLDDVMKPAGETLYWYTPHTTPSQNYLMNVAWLAPHADDTAAARIPADRFAAQEGVQTADSAEGGKCIGWINAGDWVRYADVDFGHAADTLAIRASTPGPGGRIEVRLNDPNGALLGVANVTTTGDWQKWATLTAKLNPTSGTHTICLVFKSNETPAPETNTTTLYAQMPDPEGGDPNKTGVEINVRQAVFYPSEPGINYITVRGFTLEHASPNWAPPTAEQVGLIGTHWSKGWVIENNEIRYSLCTGITLGKHGDEFDNTSADTAAGYVETIKRAHAFRIPWTKEHIGHHIIRNNHIHHCEQAGIVGSMGAVFSTVTGNTIHDINLRGLFGGAEQAGIKFHGAIDTVISENHIYRSHYFGIWLDWMTQGTRVTRNLLHDNRGTDLFVEVNHGPFLIDNNIMLSDTSIAVNSRGGAYAHNLIAGDVHVAHNEGRSTPYHPPHSTTVAGLAPNPSGDDRYYNNLFVGHNGLTQYDAASLPVFMQGNVFLAGACPSKHEHSPLVLPQFDPAIKLTETRDAIDLELTVDFDWAQQSRPLVTTELLGRAKIPDLPYVQPDDSPYRIDTDYFGAPRDTDHPFPGPFIMPPQETTQWKVWLRTPR